MSVKGTPTVELRVITHAAMDDPDLKAAQQAAALVLATADIQMVWRTCSGDGCSEPSDGRALLRLLLLPVAKRTDPSMCGEVVRDAGTRIASVLVYVPRVRQVAEAIRRGSGGRAHPALFSVSTGQVAGLTIAHEVGHAFGLRHRSSGPMKAHPDPGDFIELRAARLRFHVDEIRTLRAALTAGESAAGK